MARPRTKAKRVSPGTHAGSKDDQKTDAGMKIEYVPLGELMKWPGNPKEHDLEGLGESLERHGFVDPMILDEGTGKIVAGHGRREKLLAWRDAGKPPPDRVKRRRDGEWLVPVLRGIRFPNEHEAEAYLMGNNQLVIRGGHDVVRLAEMLARHANDASGIGWRQDEIKDILAQAEKASRAAMEQAQPPQDFRSYDEGQKKTHDCPKCGFSVACI